MFDIGFSELVVIAVVALVVIGPERLPTVARTIGALLGRLNRYVADVKSDVEREMRLEDMKKLRAEVEQQAMGFEQSVVKELEATRTAVEQPVAEAQQSLAEVMQETGQTEVAIQQEFAGPGDPAAPAEAAAQSSAPVTAQAALDFDSFSEPAPVTPAAAPSSEVKPVAKA
ncbi:MAG TPA: Sec-independent protein translocase protein TatB [Rhodocyclaceae bacterium]|nr:Sec-independent protein translocase protein TatB [Rhodocyclaceae bacterium]